MKTIITILGHTIVINNIDLHQADFKCYDAFIENINQAIFNGFDDGSVKYKGVEYEWEKEKDYDMTENYLSNKIALLEENNSVVFEHKQKIYSVSLNSSEEYEYNVYSSSTIFNQDMLEPMDGGCCTGSAKDAVYMAIGE